MAEFENYVINNNIDLKLNKITYFTGHTAQIIQRLTIFN